MDVNATLFGQAITFLIFVWFTMKFVWPAIIEALEERQKKIAEGLNAAEQSVRELELSKHRTEEAYREAKGKAAGILEQANKRANQVIEDAKEKARVEGQRIIAAAQAEIEQELIAVKEQLRGHVAGIAVSGAEKILQKDIDAKAHEALLNQLAEEI